MIDGWLEEAPDSFDPVLARIAALRPPWQRDAACAGRWDVMLGEDVEAARAVCAGCQVASQCLRFALDLEPTDGVWAGLTWEERLLVCPICGDPKPADWLGCSFAHILMRTARLMEQAEDGQLDVEIPPKQKPTAKTYRYCPVPRGHNHSTARAYKEGCRCEAARAALREERLARGEHERARGSYQVDRLAAEG